MGTEWNANLVIVEGVDGVEGVVYFLTLIFDPIKRKRHPKRLQGIRPLLHRFLKTSNVIAEDLDIEIQEDGTDMLLWFFSVPAMHYIQNRFKRNSASLILMCL